MSERVSEHFGERRADMKSPVFVEILPSHMRFGRPVQCERG